MAVDPARLYLPTSNQLNSLRHATNADETNADVDPLREGTAELYADYAKVRTNCVRLNLPVA